ncbi:sensor domain-containing diguanylate cyclase [Paenisporosarcina antarctica]|uniref:Sensor domain-containing diguanylate cyclase n=1 Tax=Paenisporosarcina antarctica TaxID=417367 RepID=A0A4V1ANG2_9BACL|nr:sensor domain-containing diguanylate cyclase [Paenisporosarcina antarctica]QBP42665.1 sensor domain-containing diguanylate cyclase [Paenisporosarcina antarctica]
MDEQLELAPVGYVVIDQDLRILEINKMMMKIAGIENAPIYMHELLTISSQIYFQTYFIPTIITHGAVSEMVLKLKNPSGAVPVLMNTKKSNGFFECAFMQMPMRSEYENELLNAKREAERISQATKEANQKLILLLNKVEFKQAELNVLNSRLQELTVTDVLTNLKNRRYLEEFLPGMMDKGTLTLLLIDIDFFKKINDAFGHHAGDIVLQEFARLLDSLIGDAGFVARIGGEEFVVVLPEISQSETEEIAEEIRKSIEVKDWSYGQMTVSIGIAKSAKGMQLSNLLKIADVALYNSKNEGRNRVTVGSSS